MQNLHKNLHESLQIWQYNVYILNTYAEFCILMRNSASNSANLCEITHYNSHAERVNVESPHYLPPRTSKTNSHRLVRYHGHLRKCWPCLEFKWLLFTDIWHRFTAVLTRLKIRMFTFTQGLRCPSPSSPSSGLRRVTILLSHLKTRCGDETSVGNAPNSGTKKIRTVPSSQPAASRPKRAKPAWLLLWPPEGHHCRLRTRPKSCAIPSEKTGKSVDVGLFLKVQNWISELSRSETDFFEGLM